MIQPGSRPSKPARSNAAAPKANCAISKSACSSEPLAGRTGIGHTRWATHGRPTERNAHPHMTAQVSVVHNGIIENFRELARQARGQGPSFRDRHRYRSRRSSRFPTKWIAGAAPIAAVREALKQLQGAFALGIIFAGHDDLMIAARKGSPLAIGHGTGEMYLGSDAIALAPFTDAITYLEEGDWAVLRRSGAEIFDRDGARVERPIIKAVASSLLVDKGNYRHFMAKEIHEQPEVISHTLANYLDMVDGTRQFPDLGVDLAKISRVTISACGTAYYAGLVAQILDRAVCARAGRHRCRLRDALPRDAAALKADCAVSFRSRARPPIRWRRFATARPTANASRRSSTSELRRSRANPHAALPTLAGPEIGVASTKAFTCQLSVLACLAIAHRPGSRPDDRRAGVGVRQSADRGAAPRCLDPASATKPSSPSLRSSPRQRDVLYLGRGSSFPIALEGALKLKEISYIHAEGYAAGELKHGPIALIDENVPVIVVAPEDDLFEKTVSNLQEVAARGGQIILISDATPEKVGCKVAAHIQMPKVSPFVGAADFMPCRRSSLPTTRRC